MKIKLSDKSKKELNETILAFFESEGEPDAQEIADELTAKVLSGEFSFGAWDALGCDDLGLVAKNKQLQKLYNGITATWQKSLKSSPH